MAHGNSGPTGEHSNKIDPAGIDPSSVYQSRDTLAPNVTIDQSGAPRHHDASTHEWPRDRYAPLHGKLLTMLAGGAIALVLVYIYHVDRRLAVAEALLSAQPQASATPTTVASVDAQLIATIVDEFSVKLSKKLDTYTVQARPPAEETANADLERRIAQLEEFPNGAEIEGDLAFWQSMATTAQLELKKAQRQLQKAEQSEPTKKPEKKPEL